MKKGLIITLYGIVPLFAFVSLYFLLQAAVEDFTLTGIARSDLYRLANVNADIPADTELTSGGDAVMFREAPIGLMALPVGTHGVIQKDLSDDSAQLVNLSRVILDPALLENRTHFSPITGKEPLVLILHTHNSEHFLSPMEIPGDIVLPDGVTALFREDAYSRETVMDVGETFASVGKENGIGVIHCTIQHDENLNTAWQASAATVAAYLKAFPSIRYIIDIHRDTLSDSNGNWISPLTPDGKTAQVRIAVGSDYEHETHADYVKNLTLAMTWKEYIDEQQASLCLPISFVNQSLNQELSAGFLTLYVGSEGSTFEQAKSGAVRTAEIFCMMLKNQ